MRAIERTGGGVQKKARSTTVAEAKKKAREVSIKALCEQVGMSRQNYYKERGNRREERIEEEKVLELVKGERRVQPRLGTRKLHHMLKKETREQGVALGRDRMFRLLRKHELLVKPKKRADCFENLQLSFFFWEVVAGTVKIDFDAREAKPGSKGLRNHGTKFRISPDDICRIYAKKEWLC